MRSLLFWSLFPFVIPQAIRVRKNAPRFSPAKGAPEGVAGWGDEYRLLAIGDSIIAGVGVKTLSRALVGQTAKVLADEMNCRIRWTAVGQSGANSRKVIDKLLPKVPAKPMDFIIISVGVNDITSLKNLSTWRDNLNTLLTLIGEHSPNAVIAVAGIPPLKGFPLLPQPMRALFGLRGETFDDAAQEIIARHPQAVYVPLRFEPMPEKFAADGYHPSEESYREFGQAMAAGILEKLTIV